MTITEVLSLLTFCLGCFAAGYKLGRDTNAKK